MNSFLNWVNNPYVFWSMAVLQIGLLIYLWKRNQRMTQKEKLEPEARLVAEYED